MLECVKILHVCNLPKENKKHVETGKNSPAPTEANPAENCAGCGEKNPEYSLDDRQLCCDCYNAEQRYLT